MNSEMSPIVSLFGKAYKKSSSAKRELSTDKNTNTEVEEENNAIASDMAKSIMTDSFRNNGLPSSLFPPGAVKIAAKAIVTFIELPLNITQSHFYFRTPKDFTAN